MVLQLINGITYRLKFYKKCCHVPIGYGVLMGQVSLGLGWTHHSTQ